MSGIYKGLGLGSSLGIIICLYAVAFYAGGYLRIHDIEEGGEPYTGGKVIAVMFTVLIGAMQIGSAMNQIKSLTEARVACKLAYDTMDATIKVDPSKEGEKIEKSQIRGEIKF